MAVAVASKDVDYAVTAISGGLISLAEKGAAKVIGGALMEEPGIDGQKILVSDAALVDKTAGDEAAEAMVKLVHKYVYADRPYEKAAPSIRNGAMRISNNAALNMESVKDQLEWFQSEKLVKESITLDTLVDSSYITQ